LADSFLWALFGGISGGCYDLFEDALGGFLGAAGGDDGAGVEGGVAGQVGAVDFLPRAGDRAQGLAVVNLVADRGICRPGVMDLQKVIVVLILGVEDEPHVTIAASPPDVEGRLELVQAEVLQQLGAVVAVLCFQPVAAVVVVGEGKVGVLPPASERLFGYCRLSSDTVISVVST